MSTGLQIVTILLNQNVEARLNKKSPWIKEQFQIVKLAGPEWLM